MGKGKEFFYTFNTDSVNIQKKCGKLDKQRQTEIYSNFQEKRV